MRMLLQGVVAVAVALAASAALALAASAAVALAAPAAVAADEPSFDCSKAAAAIEVLICNDSELMRLDGALGVAFASRRGALSGGAREALLRDQRQWLEQRLTRCGIPAKTDALTLEQRWAWAPCVAEMYRGRLAALGAPEDAREDAREDAPAPPPAAARPGYLHPLCLGLAVRHLYGESEQPMAVPVAACNAGNRHEPVEVAGNGQLSARGASDGWRDWIGYSALGRFGGDGEAVLVYYNGGGTGTFSQIVRLRRATIAGSGDGVITAEQIVGGGDRCMGGITSAAIGAGGELRYAVNALAGDFLAAGGTEPASTEGLPYCSICCYAELAYRIAPDGSPPRLMSATIEASDADTPESDTTFRCLEAVVREQAGALPHTFSPAEIRSITEAFNRRCAGR